jgi:protein subunit release factor A
MLERKEIVERELKPAAAPKDPNDDKNVIIKSRRHRRRSGALRRRTFPHVFARYAETQNWKVEI